MTPYIPYLFGLAALGIGWDGLRRWLAYNAARTDDKFITRDEFEREHRLVLDRCDKNTTALESHAKHAADHAAKTDARFNSMALRQGRTG